jgi:hypothetical protein
MLRYRMAASLLPRLSPHGFRAMILSTEEHE